MWARDRRPLKKLHFDLQSVSWTPGASFESKSSFSFAAPTATCHEFEAFKDATHILVIELVVSMFGMSKVSLVDGSLCFWWGDRMMGCVVRMVWCYGLRMLFVLLMLVGLVWFAGLSILFFCRPADGSHLLNCSFRVVTNCLWWLGPTGSPSLARHVSCLGFCTVSIQHHICLVELFILVMFFHMFTHLPSG